MIVYRDQRSRADPRVLLAHLRSTLRSLSSETSHACAVDVLFQAGVLESALVDTLSPESDDVHPLSQTLRKITTAAGHLLWHTWHGESAETRAWSQRMLPLLDGLEASSLPGVVTSSVPEGFAYYGVYPEMYLEAAKRCHAVLGQFRAVCLGLRSIGTSLSSVVAAALEELGCEVKSFTLRPRGHPFARTISMAPGLEGELRPLGRSHFLIIDEGPGISGSSMAGTAAQLRALGIEHDHILLFPSWRTDGSQLRSAVARGLWPSHRQFHVSFEEAWLDSGRLADTFRGQLEDVSAGAWRHKVYPTARRYPAVQPQHERRKYLLLPNGSEAEQQILLSFAGLGVYGRGKLDRGVQLAEAGYSPAPERLAHGFLARRFLPGRPALPHRLDSQLLDTIASYLGYLYHEHTTEPTVSEKEVREMVAVNVREGLGEAWHKRLKPILPLLGRTERSVALDGRMLPQEWIRTPSGYVKTDATDHHADHFFPGCQDIAWDIAGAILELGLSRSARSCLLNRYRQLSCDHTIGRRLPAHAISYLAFRLGYSRLAVQVLGASPDARRFAVAARRYARLLRLELSNPCGDRWNG